jgi:hypothetical protein
MKIKIEWIMAVLFLLILTAGYKRLTDSFYIIHDNLDSEVIFKTQPTKEGQFFQLSNEAVVSGYLGEIPKNAYTNSPFNLVSWFFYLFPPAWAMWLISVLVRVVAFTGMMLFLTALSGQEISFMRRLSIGFLSIGFAMLPFYTIHGFAIAALPLALFALVKIHRNQQLLLGFGILLGYGLSSSFVLGGFAFLFLVAWYSLWLIIRKKEAKWRFLMAGILLALALVLSDIGIFVQFLTDGQFVSHRTEWVLNGLALKPMLNASFELFVNGQYHAPSEHLPLLLFTPFLFVFNWKNCVRNWKLWLLILGLIGTAIFAGFYKSIYALDIRNSISFLKVFQFDRFYFLYAVAWILCYFYVSDSTKFWKQYIALCGAVGFSIFAIAKNEEWYSNLTNNKSSEHVALWNNYYGVTKSNELYALVTPQKTKRVLHYGLDPAVGAFLGYSTVDGYHTNYPVQIKHDFLDLLEPALGTNKIYLESIQSWGSKLILPVNAKHQVFLNWEKAKSMQLSYIFSAYRLEENNHFHLKGIVSDFNCFGDLHVYELN